jgi:hypothetical protein
VKFVKCDFCGEELAFDEGGLDTAPVMLLGPGIIYYPTRNFGSHNGAEVHMMCAVVYQAHLVSIGIVDFGA